MAAAATIPGIHGYGTHAARLAQGAGQAGATFFENDTNTLWRDNGSTWDQLPLGGAGSFYSWTAKSANYTITGADSGIKMDATGGARTVTLPTAVGVTQRFAVIKADSSVNTVTIATTSAQTINGASTQVISTQYAGYEVMSDGANWFVVAIPVSSGGGGALTSQTAQLGSDISLTTLTWTDILTLSLVAGTWLITGATVLTNAGAVYCHVRFYDGSASLASLEVTVTGANLHQNATLPWIVTLGSTTTLHFQAFSHGVGSTVKAALVLDGVGNNVSSFLAIKLA